MFITYLMQRLIPRAFIAPLACTSSCGSSGHSLSSHVHPALITCAHLPLQGLKKTEVMVQLENVGSPPIRQLGGRFKEAGVWSELGVVGKQGNSKMEQWNKPYLEEGKTRPRLKL